MKIPPFHTAINLYIGQKIYDLRAERKYSVQYMAQYLKVAPKTYKQWEKGTSTIKTSDLHKLALLFDMNIDYFFPAFDDISVQQINENSPPLVPIMIKEDGGEQHLMDILKTFAKFDGDTCERVNIFIKHLVKISAISK